MKNQVLPSSTFSFAYTKIRTPSRTHVGMEEGGVAYWAHAGGFVFGAILGYLLGLFKDESSLASID
jgi:membrane associated rhomboid family serine protease